MSDLNQKYKVRVLWEKTTKNEEDVSKLEKKITKIETISYQNKIQKITIFEDYLLPNTTDAWRDPPGLPDTPDWTGGINFIVNLDGFPEWVIPFIRVVPIFSVEDKYAELIQNDSYDIEYEKEFRYYWKKIDDTHFQIKGFIDGYLATETGDWGVLYFSLYLYIRNERFFDELQQRKV